MCLIHYFLSADFDISNSRQLHIDRQEAHGPCRSAWEPTSKQIGHLPKFQKLHIYSISTSGVEIELIFTLWAAVSEIRAHFKNCHIWAWNLAIGQVPEVAHIPSFYRKGSKLILF